ncbi:MAG: DNA repair protein RecO [Gammaproteobacteria bacterium]|nr:DNA repair protein RecO [Gammaproteobacteria bacterium]
MASAGLQPAYTLHTRRYGNSSQLLELFLRDQGRAACIARGALRNRRGGSAVQPFQRLAVEIAGRGEVGTLTRAEVVAAPLRLRGSRMYCGLYVNELVMRLTARHDAHPLLFDAYADTIAELGGEAPVEPLLRRFEVRLLQETGFGLALDTDLDGHRLDDACHYTYQAGSGAQRATAHDRAAVSGRTLRALRTGELHDADVLREARTLMRQVLDHHLDGRPLRSRDLFQSNSRNG